MDMLGRRGILPSSRGDARNPAFLAAVSLIRSSMRPGVLSPPVLILPHSMEPSLWSMVPTTVSGETSFCVREGNGTPLQYSCLENPMDGGAWWAAIHGVAKSWTQLSDFTFMNWRRKWQPIPVFLPGESQGRGSLVGCRLWGGTELDMTEAI